jgi:hypothetical protein
VSSGRDGCGGQVARAELYKTVIWGVQVDAAYACACALVRVLWVCRGHEYKGGSGPLLAKYTCGLALLGSEMFRRVGCPTGL